MAKANGKSTSPRDSVARLNSGSSRTYVSQSDVPANTLEDALRIAAAVNEYGGKAKPLQVAAALNMSPTSGPFRSLCGSSIAYGLTTGGYSAPEITLTALSKRILKPLEEGDDLIAKREAALKPRVISDFLNRYNNAALPRHDIALNVLSDLEVPRKRAESVYRLILDTADSLKLLKTIKDKQYVDISGVTQTPADVAKTVSSQENLPENSVGNESEPVGSGLSQPTQGDNRRVFVTHGKNKTFLDPIKRLLEFGELVPVISVERQSVSKPVPDKVMDDMRSCGAAIIHVDDELRLMDKDTNEHIVLNSNVLIEIGAAMALFGRRFILLVKDGTKLPTNLQGLYEVRYTGDSLDGDATIRLLGAIKDIKNNPLPARGNVA